MKIIPINNGYYNCKSIDNKIFKSRLMEAPYNSLGCGGDRFKINGKTYIVGEGRPSFKKDKTDNDATKIFVLNMLSKFMEGSERFKVILTSPPLAYASQRELLPKYLIGKHEVEYNNVKKEIIIDDVTVYPETIMAYIANNPSQFKRSVIVIDIGGVTTNSVLIKNGVYSKDDISSFSNGMYHLENSICEHFNSKYYEDLELSPEDISRILKDGLVLPRASMDLVEVERIHIDRIFNNHIDKILEKFEYKGWNTSACDILITGGGGKVLFDTIKDNHLPQAKLSFDPVFDNLRGLEIMAKRGV